MHFHTKQEEEKKKKNSLLFNSTGNFTHVDTNIMSDQGAFGLPQGIGKDTGNLQAHAPEFDKNDKGKKYNISLRILRVIQLC